MFAVVLIIGILAAVMIPQYQFAIKKTKAMERINLASDIYRAQQQYYLINNDYATNWDNLDMSFPRCPSDDKANYACNLKNRFNQIAITFKFGPANEDAYNIYVALFDYAGTKRGSVTCEGSGATDSVGHKICEAFCLNKNYNQVWNRSCLISNI